MLDDLDREIVVFAEELAAWGPDAVESQSVPSRTEAEAYCRRLATTHYENFPLVSRLLPRSLRQHFYNVYAYCRWADDLGDEVGEPARAWELLGWWRGELQQCYAGGARHPVFVALRPTIEQFRIPIQPFEDLISAFEQDQQVREYETFAQLRDYCRRSADPVGRIVLHVCGQYTAEHAAWSDSICTGLQLANFWQDVARDYAIGRIYLPREDYERCGVRREDFDRRTSTPGFIELMKVEVDRARDWLQRGLPLVERLPGRLQVDIDLFARGGLKVLDRIERIGYRVWETRPVVRKTDLVGLFCGAVARGLWRQVFVRKSTIRPATEAR
jgi:squalene synthase HpnC